ncbi:MAG: hypothetical protein KKB62_00975 [Nanoarchaeota archaeon]|nr:hypothetical protein [Nanoarchaeota archaeon]
MEKSPELKLLKIDIDIDPKEEFKKRMSFSDSQIKKISVKEKKSFFYKFNFESVFEYSGKKEIFENEIYVFNGKIIEGNLNEYALLDGNEKEVKIPDFENYYFMAKKELKKIIQEKTNQITKKLSLEFEAKKSEIEEKFRNETSEFRKSIKEITDNLMALAKEGNMKKIIEEKKLIESLKKKFNFEDIEKDKTMEVELETQKHILNVENRLLRTTVIYYPSFNFICEINNMQVSKSFLANFDPVSEEFQGAICDNCSGQTKEVYLCMSGHITCKKCSVKCDSCKKGFCKKCLKNTCEICSKKICKDCSTRCFRCSKVVCKSHTQKDKITGFYYCTDCLKRCERCSELRDPYSFKVSKKTNAQICEECFRKEMQEKVLGGVFDE